MFSFLKNKLKSAINIFTSKVEETPAEKIEEAPEEKPTPQPFEPIQLPKTEATEPEEKIEKFAVKETKIKEKKPKIISQIETHIPASQPLQQKTISAPSQPSSVEEISEETVPEEKRGIFRKIKEALTTKAINDVQFNELFWDIELVMLENNVAVDVIEKVKKDLNMVIVGKPLPRTKIKETVMTTLRTSLSALFIEPDLNLSQLAKQHKPLVIAFIGINGSGKTTTIAKLAHALQQQGHSIVMAAADTFRAAAIDQLQYHADKLGCKLIKHDYGADAAAVAFDAIKHAKAKNKDIVLIDTAGRLHSNTNLIEELKKIMRVAKPHLKLFIGESITGNDCTEQARQFNETVGIDGIILSKADIDEKGGTALSISYVTKKPILYLGTGQEYKDLQAFDKNKLLAQIGI